MKIKVGTLRDDQHKSTALTLAWSKFYDQILGKLIELENQRMRGGLLPFGNVQAINLTEEREDLATRLEAGIKASMISLNTMA